MKRGLLKKTSALLIALTLVSGALPFSQADGSPFTITASAVPDEPEIQPFPHTDSDPVHVSTWSGLQTAINEATEETDIIVEGGSAPLTPAEGDAAITVENGKSINIYLYRSLDRGLTDAQEDGCVIINHGTLNIYGFGYEGIPDETANNSCCITGGSNTESGGGIANDGTLRVVNVDITGNRSSLGGGLYNNNKAWVVYSNVISNETVEGRWKDYYSSDYGNGYGGGIYSGKGDGTHLYLIDSSVTDNNSVSSGGGVYVAGCMHVSGAVIIENNKGTTERYVPDEAAGLNEYGEYQYILVSEETDDNLCLPAYSINDHQTRPGYSTLYVDSDLTGSRIHVNGAGGQAFTRGYPDHCTADPSTIFISDQEDVIFSRVPDTSSNYAGEVVLEYVYFRGVSVTCTDGLTVNFTVNLHLDGPYGVIPNIRVNWADHYETITDSRLLTATDEDGVYILPVHLPAKCFADQITVSLYRQGVSYGDAIEIEDLGSCTYSVVDYLATIIENEEGKYSDSEVNLAKSVFTYCCSAAELFNYNTNIDFDYAISELELPDPERDLEHADTIKQDIKEKVDDDPAHAVRKYDLSDLGLQYYGMSLILEDTTAVELYFRITDSSKFGDDYRKLMVTQRFPDASFGSGYSDKTEELFFEQDEGDTEFIHVKLTGFSPDELIKPQHFHIAYYTVNDGGDYVPIKETDFITVNPCDYILLALKLSDSRYLTDENGEYILDNNGERQLDNGYITRTHKLKCTVLELYGYYISAQRLIDERAIS